MIGEASRRRAAKTIARTKTFPAPTRGWIRNESLIKPKSAGAALLDNWIPLEKSVRMRRGKTKWATIGSGQPCTALMEWTSGGATKLFAGNSLGIYDITAPASPTVSPSVAVARTADTYSWTQITNSAGAFLMVCNGADDVCRFNGSTWTTTSGITGVSGAALSATWLFKARLWFVEKNTLNAWYLGTDAISGAATKFPLGGIFKLGGSLLFGASWSVDAGDGYDDKLVLVTDQGEVAIYAGADPASLALQGLYRIGKPLGNLAFLRAGGDLVIATTDGLVPLSSAIVTDRNALSLKALSYPIEPEWREEVDRRAARRWQMAVWAQVGVAIVAMPSRSSQPQRCLVINHRTGAWARWTNHDTESVAFWNDAMYAGTQAGVIFSLNKGVTDDGAAYVASYIGLSDDCGAMGATKIAQAVRPTVLSNYDPNTQAQINVEYNTTLPTAPAAGTGTVSSNAWGTAIWGTSTWGEDAAVQYRFATWRDAGGEGTMMAPVVQITGGAVLPAVDLISVDLLFEIAATVF